MTKHCWLIVVVLVTSGCDGIDPNSCKVSCSTNADCPTGLACGELGLCAADGDTCSCTPGEFVACDANGALFCNAAATGVTAENCGARGCNATVGGCNACVADTIACSADLATLDHCGGDSVVFQSDACPAGCVVGTSGAPDQCAHIQPAWLPDVCNEAAAMASASLADTINTEQDSTCTGGVVQVNGTTFCIVHAGTINIGDLKVSGTRPIAFVADDDLTVSGTLDVSADGATPGPGAGSLGAGTSVFASYKGGSGAGFAQTGGSGGGGQTGSDPGPSGGVVTERLPTNAFVGGATGGHSICGTGLCVNSINFDAGGGGGGALLIACRRKVSVTGTIDAGGGGGTGGGDYRTDSNIAPGGAPGGGSGGFVVFQGPRVEITGKLYANGGGGGAGCTGDNCRGQPGSDGLRSLSGAPGGPGPFAPSTGGNGGSVSIAPHAGYLTDSNSTQGAGGGGGSMGRFEVFTLNGATPVLTPAEASPAPTQSSTTLSVQ